MTHFTYKDIESKIPKIVVKKEYSDRSETQTYYLDRLISCGDKMSASAIQPGDSDCYKPKEDADADFITYFNKLIENKIGECIESGLSIEQICNYLPYFAFDKGEDIYPKVKIVGQFPATPKFKQWTVDEIESKLTDIIKKVGKQVAEERITKLCDFYKIANTFKVAVS